MRAYCLFSGSRGNCYYIGSEGAEILIDAGKSARAIEAELAKLGTSEERLLAIFLTHTHIDHASALPTLIKRTDAKIFCTEKSADALTNKGISVEKICVMDTKNTYKVGDINAKCFETSHDCEGSVGFRFDFENGESLALATDLGTVTDSVFLGVCGADYVVLESNHDIKMLTYGPYPQQLKKRILSPRGHLSNDACAELLHRLALSGTKRFLLAHLSEENNDRKIAFDSAKRALFGLDCTFDIAKQNEAVMICKK